MEKGSFPASSYTSFGLLIPQRLVVFVDELLEFLHRFFAAGLDDRRPLTRGKVAPFLHALGDVGRRRAVGVHIVARNAHRPRACDPLCGPAGRSDYCCGRPRPAAPGRPWPVAASAGWAAICFRLPAFGPGRSGHPDSSGFGSGCPASPAPDPCPATDADAIGPSAGRPDSDRPSLGSGVGEPSPFSRFCIISWSSIDSARRFLRQLVFRIGLGAELGLSVAGFLDELIENVAKLFLPVSPARPGRDPDCQPAC